MKRHTVLFFILLCTSCYPQYSDTNTYKPVYDQVTVNGYVMWPNAATIEVTDSQKNYLSVYGTMIAPGRLNDSATCTLYGWPTGITDSNGAGTFRLPGGFISVIDVNTDTGVYSINMSVTNPLGSFIYPVKLHVVPRPARSGYDSLYYGDDVSAIDEVIYSTYISTAANNKYQVDITNLSGRWDVSANITGSYPSAIIKIPLQAINGAGSIYGTGFSAPDTGSLANGKPMIFIRDTVIYAGDTQTWVVNLKPHPLH